MPLVPVDIIVVDDAGADAAEQAVTHQFDGIAPDVAQTVAARGINPPEASASHHVVAVGQENDFITPDDPVVPPVHDGNTELIHSHIATVPKLLPIPDAKDIDPFSVPMVVAVVTVPRGRRGCIVMTAVRTTGVVVPDFVRCWSLGGIMMGLPRCAYNGEEQR